MIKSALPALSVAPGEHPLMLDVAIALLTTARGREPAQVGVLIEASQILLGAIVPADETIEAPTPSRSPRKAPVRGIGFALAVVEGEGT